MDPTFRTATEADADLLLPLMREYYAYDGHAYDEPRARLALVNFLREPSFGQAWVIFDGAMPDGETPIGYIVLTFGYSLEYLGRDAFIDEFYLRESHRGRGWGRKALEFVEEAARTADVRAIHLEVIHTNTGAKEVYRHAGYLDHDHYLMSKWIEKDFEKPALKRP
jgi:ribosomal protein S18 acetylase RimI-like enzyme